MASLKDVRLKINGVSKTRQITKAMYMVASAKLRGAQMRIEHFRPYADKFSDMLRDLGEKTDDAAHPLLAVRSTQSIGIVVCTPDRGLCGGFNANIIALALKFAESKITEGKKVVFYCIGRKGRDAIRSRGYKPALSIINRMGDTSFALAVEVGGKIRDDFLRGILDEVHMFYGKFISMARQRPADMRLLPIAGPEPEQPQNEKAGQVDYVYEPAVADLLTELLPKYIDVQIYRGLLDTSAGENAARMQAMDNATRNCDEMVKALTLLMNKTRQAAITSELIDIVGGVEALKG
ncbi:MAG: F0F1 ATP synthase subunit gamma [Desulfovibrio sp.]|jgi:F-type H+-transporting ATPase subunit gamma|nr:F0F1 ATP synthase subunit gamma [Desulfovibrio sp.]